MTEQEPTRLRFGDRPELADALGQARDRGPSDADIARLADALGVVLPVPPSPPAAPVAVATVTAASLATKILPGLLAAVLVVGGLVVLTTRSPTKAPRPAPVAAPARPVDVPPVAEIHAPAPAPPAPEVVVPAAPPVVVEDPAARLREEVALIQRAESMLRSNPRESLKLANEHRRRFPRGALDQESAVIAIDAMLRLGMREAAETRAAAFDRAHGGSIHSRRIHRLLDAHADP